MNMNKHIVTNTNEESMNMPSQPALLDNEVVCYYVDAKGLAEGDVGSEEPLEVDNADVTQLLVDTHNPHSGTPLKSFLRLSVERVVEKAIRGLVNVLRLIGVHNYPLHMST